MKKSVAAQRRFKQRNKVKEGAAERRAERIARDANERFMKSGIKIRDVYGKLADQMRAARIDPSIHAPDSM